VYETFKLAVTSFVLPPGGPIVLVALGALAPRQYPRTGRTLVVVGAAALWLLSLPVVAGALVTLLGGARPLDLAAARQADAIVILGGGVRAQAPEYGGDTLGRLTLERVRYGARVARETELPVLVTGGAPGGGTAEAPLMRDVLEREYGVPVRWVEPQSRDTHENAIFSARLLKADGIGRIVLVGHAFDMPRGIAEFAAAGLDVIPAPTGIPRFEHDELLDYVPSMAGLQASYYASYELLANAVRAIKATVQ